MMVYILKFSACLVIFLLFYKWVLEKENMHNFKRVYLLGSLLFSLGIPLITFTSYVEVETLTQFIQEVNFETNTKTIEPQTNYIPLILWSIYGLGVLIFGIKFIRNLIQLVYSINNNPKRRTINFSYVLLKGLVVPYTFLNYIFLNKKKFDQNQIPEEVLWHEEAHVIQKHSLDILFIQLLQIIFWFNPLVYIIIHFIKLNHEFLADQIVINKGIETSAYQQTLLNFSSNLVVTPLASAINYSSIKKRLTIMKKQTTKQSFWIRSLVILPLLAVLIYSFSDKVLIEENSSNTNIINDKAINTNINIYISNNGDIQINNKSVDKDNLLSELVKIKENLSIEEQYSLTSVNLIIGSETSESSILQVKNTIRKFGILKINTRQEVKNKYQNSNENKLLEYLDKATEKQLVEYNKLAKKYNDMSPNELIVKLQDVNRLKYLYRIMTLDQRRAAQPFPYFPDPPPSPIVKKGEESDIPPPPDKPSVVITKINNQKVHITGDVTLTQKVINENIPPPPPVSPLVHVKKMANVGAIFYLEEKKISADKAIGILKNNKKINISTTSINAKKPVVKLSAKPITIDN